MSSGIGGQWLCLSWSIESEWFREFVTRNGENIAYVAIGALGWYGPASGLPK